MERANKIGRVVAFLVLAADLLIGAGWAFGDAKRSNTPVNKPVKDFLSFLPGDPAHWWGGLLLVLVGLVFIAMFTGNRFHRPSSELHTRYAFALLFSYWAMWTFAYAIGVVTSPNAAISPIGLAFTQAVGHLRPILSSQRLTKTGDGN